MQRRIRSLATLTLLVMAALVVSKLGTPVLARDSTGDDLIRLHIIAHSDDPYDQALKLKVRDAVIARTGHLFADVVTRKEAETILEEHIDKVLGAANEVLNQAGSSYGCQAQVGSYPFPQKEYGDLVLPAGRYRALKIILGDGRGSNWWCVLFPPLCFVNGSLGPKDVAKPVSASPEEGAQQVMASGDVATTPTETEDAKVEVRFKVVELWQKVRPQALALVSRK